MKTCIYDTSSKGAVFASVFLLMGKDILYNNMNFPERAAARAVCLGSHAARGDYGGCDSARAARLRSHAALGGHSSASTMRVVAMARLARCALSGGCTDVSQSFVYVY